MNVHRALVQAIAGNAPHWKPDVVLSQAVESLCLEAQALREIYEESSDNDLTSRLYYLENRLRAFEAFTQCLDVDYQKHCEDAFAFDDEPAETAVADA